MLRWLLALQLGVTCVLGAACGRGQEVQPLALTGLASDSLVEGDALALVGEGLPPGLAATVELRGVLHAPGRVERAVEVALSGRTLSPERLRAALPPDLLEEWGRASFDGSLSVRARDAGGAGFAASLRSVSFDLDAQSPRASQQLRRSVEIVLEPLGVGLSDGDSWSEGLPVARVQPGGAAWRAGLRVGDVIVSANGVRVGALGDLAPAPNVNALALGVRANGSVRAAQGSVRLVSLPLAHAAPIVNPRGLAWCILACPALFLLLTLLPLPAPSVWLRYALERARVSRELWATVPLAIGAGVLCARFQQHLDPFAILLLHLGVLVALRAWRGRDWRSFGLQVAALWLAVACAAAMSGRLSLLSIVRDQGAGPWAWNVFARPPLAAALFLCLRYAAQLHACCRSEQLEFVGRALLCGLFATLFLGGAGAASFAGVALAASKSVLCLGLWSLAPALPSSLRRESSWLAGTLAATLLWSWCAPNRSFELALGSGLCVFAVFLTAVACLQLRAAGASGVSPVSPT